MLKTLSLLALFSLRVWANVIDIALDAPTGCFPLGTVAECLTQNNSAYEGDLVTVGGGTEVNVLYDVPETIQLGSIGFGAFQYPSPNGTYFVDLPVLVNVFYGHPPVTVMVEFQDSVVNGEHALSIVSTAPFQLGPVPIPESPDYIAETTISASFKVGYVTTIADFTESTPALMADVELTKTDLFIGIPEPRSALLLGIALAVLVFQARAKPARAVNEVI